MEPVDALAALPVFLARGLEMVQSGGGGQTARFICGFLACEPQLSRSLLGGLPAMLKVNIRDDALAGTRDPSVSRALSVLHQRFAEPWTVAGLAREVGVSRTVLADRFRHFLGEPPIAYLTHWRLRLGARALNASSRSIAEVASEVGYRRNLSAWMVSSSRR